MKTRIITIQFPADMSDEEVNNIVSDTVNDLPRDCGIEHTVSNPEPRYTSLVVGERIREGDEYKSALLGWVRTECAGDIVMDTNVNRYRRPL